MQKLESNNIKHFWLQRAYSAPSGSIRCYTNNNKPLIHLMDQG